MREAVVDASVLATLVVETPPDLFDRLASYEALHAPAHVDLEVLSSLRGLLLGGHLSPERFVDLALRIEDLPVERHGMAPLLTRAVELAYNVTPYDAVYVALAEGLGVELVTRDGRLARSPELRCTVVLV